MDILQPVKVMVVVVAEATTVVVEVNIVVQEAQEVLLIQEFLQMLLHPLEGTLVMVRF